jgi:hypothetical protein
MKRYGGSCSVGLEAHYTREKEEIIAALIVDV